MAGKALQQGTGILYRYLNNKNWLIGSGVFFLLVALIYIVYTPPMYKVKVRLRISDKQQPESVISGIKSKPLVKKVIDQLPFQVSYFHKGFLKKTEIYGDSLPIKFFVANPRTATAPVEVIANILDRNTYEIDQNDTLTDIPFNSVASYPFAKFKAEKGPAFAEKNKRLILRFNNPKQTLDDYYKNLNAKLVSDADNTIEISVISTNPQKGVDFLNKLVEVYNLSKNSAITAKPVADNTSRKNIQQVRKELVSLQDRAKTLNNVQTKNAAPVAKVKHKVTGINKSIQLASLEAIEPYAKSPVNQFVLIPDSYQVNDSELEKLIIGFNTIQEDKQSDLQNPKENATQIANLNVQLAAIKQTILQKINQKKIELSEGANSEAYAMNSSPRLAETESKINRQLKEKQQEYKNLLSSQTGTNLTADTKPKLTIIENSNEHVFNYSKIVFVCLLALLTGLAVPLVVPYFKHPINL